MEQCMHSYLIAPRMSDFYPMCNTKQALYVFNLFCHMEVLILLLIELYHRKND